MSEKQTTLEDYHISHYLSVDGDSRYPLFVLSGAFGNVGYTLNPSTGELDRVCICSAHSCCECTCGAWD